MDLILALPAIAMICILAFKAGQFSKDSPSEEEMIRRLVSARAERHVQKWTAAEVEREIEEAALAKARRS